MSADAPILASARGKGLSVMIRDDHFVKEFYPQYLDEYVRIFEGGGGKYYYDALGKVRGLCEEKGLRCEVNWGGE